MALTVQTAKDIQDFVFTQPRTIQEVAKFLGKNWRTAESYVDEVISQYGTLGVKTFRQGTRGALKIVYWSHFEKIHANSAQEDLLEQIKNGRRKTDLDAYDIYQYADEKKKSFTVRKTGISEDDLLIKQLSSCRKNVLIFSGNMSFVARKIGNKTALDAIKELAKAGISIKIIARLDVASVKNLHDLMKINKAIGQDLIEVRHRYQPLRGFIFDSEAARLKDNKEKKNYKNNELVDDITISYQLDDPIWVSWLEKVFWHLFSQAVPAKERLAELERINEKAVSKL